MTDITIPPEAIEAAARALCIEDGRDPDETFGSHDDGSDSWPAWIEYRGKARAACLAMLRAWPGMAIAPRHEHPLGDTPAHIILPITENSDE